MRDNELSKNVTTALRTTSAVTAVLGLIPLAARAVCTTSNNVLECQARSDSSILNVYIPTFLAVTGLSAYAARKVAGSNNNVAPNPNTAVSGDIVLVRNDNNRDMAQNLV